MQNIQEKILEYRKAIKFKTFINFIFSLILRSYSASIYAGMKIKLIKFKLTEQLYSNGYLNANREKIVVFLAHLS